LAVAKAVTCLISQGYLGKSNDVEAKCLHQLQTNSIDIPQRWMSKLHVHMTQLHAVNEGHSSIIYVFQSLYFSRMISFFSLQLLCGSWKLNHGVFYISI
jgi:hypothetical protein